MTIGIPIDVIHEEELQGDPEYRRIWEETALARLVSERVLAYRIGHGLTQTQLAQQLGLRQPHDSRLETVEQTPTLDTLRLLAAKLCISFHLDITPTGDESAHLEARAS